VGRAVALAVDWVEVVRAAEATVGAATAAVAMAVAMAAAAREAARAVARAVGAVVVLEVARGVAASAPHRVGMEEETAHEAGGAAQAADNACEGHACEGYACEGNAY